MHERLYAAILARLLSINGVSESDLGGIIAAHQALRHFPDTALGLSVLCTTRRVKPPLTLEPAAGDAKVIPADDGQLRLLVVQASLLSKALPHETPKAPHRYCRHP